MKLTDRLNQAIASHDLNPIQVEEKPVSKPVVGPVQFATFDFLKEASKAATKISPDEDGIRKAIVKQVGLEEINLPMKTGKFIVDDIQKRIDGTYEVHFVEA